MTISALWRYRIRQILPFGIIWMLLGSLFLLIEHLAIGDESLARESAIRLETSVVIYALVGIFIIGCIFGTIHSIWISKLFNDRSFGRKLLIEFGK